MGATSVLCLLFFICVSDSARILGYFPTPSISHQVVFRTLTEELARRGHEVIVISTDSSPNPPKNYTEIVLHDKSYELWKAELTPTAANRKQMDSPISMLHPMVHAMTKIVDYQVSTPQFQTILKLHDNYFDLLIVESVTPFTYSLTYKFKAPLIGISSMIGTLANFEAVGAPTHAHLYPYIFSQYTGQLTFTQKLSSLYYYYKTKQLTDDFYYQMDAVAKKHFGPNIPSLKDLEVENTDLLFLNANPIFKGIRPVPQNTIYLNGLHLNLSRAEITMDLRSYLDAADEGVIYFSMGTNVLMKNFPPEKLQLFIDVFNKLPFKVLWKFEEDYLPGQPENVKINKWFPQMDLLGHKNIKLFIMQGGQQSVDEAIFNQVPMIAIPILGDQDMNAQMIQLHGLGVQLDFNSLTKEGLMDTIHTIVSNASYKENVIKFSKLIEDHEMRPIERAIWWTEYLLRHKSAKHLRSPAAGITWTEFLLLDVFAFIFGTIVFSIILLILILMYLDLKDFSDAAEEGVIYFSMGSNMLIKNFSPEILQIFIEVFKKLPFKILWKYEDDYLPGQPENVKIMKWLPQMDLLGHKNIKLFLMQGGQQSIASHKVPMIAIPIIVDQDINAQRVQLHGLGAKLDFTSLTQEGLMNAIHTVSSNVSYKENVIKFSKLIEDHEMRPIERAIWWTEYLLRHKSAKHLRSPAAGITWTEFLLLDVFAFIFGIILISIILTILILMYLVKVFKSRSKLKKN